MTLKRRRSQTLKGYKKLGGKSRRYSVPKGKEIPSKEDPSGRTISRRQYENLRLAGRGFSSWSEVQRASPKSAGVTKEDYLRWRKRASDVTGISERELDKENSEFNRLLAKAADDDFDHKAQGTFDDFLVYLQYRQPDMDIDIGVDSP